MSCHYSCPFSYYFTFFFSPTFIKLFEMGGIIREKVCFFFSYFQLKLFSNLEKCRMNVVRILSWRNFNSWEIGKGERLWLNPVAKERTSDLRKRSGAYHLPPSSMDSVICNPQPSSDMVQLCNLVPLKKSASCEGLWGRL